MPLLGISGDAWAGVVGALIGGTATLTMQTPSTPENGRRALAKLARRRASSFSESREAAPPSIESGASDQRQIRALESRARRDAVKCQTARPPRASPIGLSLIVQGSSTARRRDDRIHAIAITTRNRRATLLAAFLPILPTALLALAVQRRRPVQDRAAVTGAGQRDRDPHLERALSGQQLLGCLAQLQDDRL
jgi:hypothetical protein